jgi:hypothetical protein
MMNWSQLKIALVSTIFDPPLETAQGPGFMFETCAGLISAFRSA